MGYHCLQDISRKKNLIFDWKMKQINQQAGLFILAETDQNKVGSSGSYRIFGFLSLEQSVLLLIYKFHEIYKIILFC